MIKIDVFSIDFLFPLVNPYHGTKGNAYLSKRDHISATPFFVVFPQLSACAFFFCCDRVLVLLRSSTIHHLLGYFWSNSSFPSSWQAKLRFSLIFRKFSKIFLSTRKNDRFFEQNRSSPCPMAWNSKNFKKSVNRYQKSKRASKNSSSQTFWKRSKIVFHKDVVEI